MSASAERDTCREANETETGKRCCELFERSTHGGDKPDKRLKPALSWIAKKKLPALPIAGYVCKGCRKELYKLKDDLRKLGLSRQTTRRGLIQLAIKPSVVLRRLPDSCRGSVFRVLPEDNVATERRGIPHPSHGEISRGTREIIRNRIFANAIMESRAGRSVDDRKSLAGMSRTKQDGDVEERKRTEPLKRSIASEHSSANRKKLLQPSHDSNQNFVPSCFRKEKSQSKHRDDAGKKRQTKSSRNIPQQSDTLIPSAAVGTVPSISVVGESKTYENKFQESSMSRAESLKLRCSHTQNFVREAAKKDPHIDSNITSTNRRDMSAETSNIKAAPSPSSSKDESLSKYAQHVHKSAHKSSHSESNTAFSKDKSFSISGKKANISVNQKCPSSESKSSETTEPIRLKKHSDSKSSINFSKNDVIFSIFARRHEKKKKSKTEVTQESFSVKTKLMDTIVQECSYKSKKDNIFSESNVSSSSNTIISELKTCSNAKVNDSVDEAQDASISEKYTQNPSHVDSELLTEQVSTLLDQTLVKKDAKQTDINLESDSSRTDSLSIERNSKTVGKRRMSSENLDQNISPTKMRKQNKRNTSPDKKVVNSNTETFDNEIFSKDERAHVQRRCRENIIKRMIRERKNYKLLRQKKELHRKDRDKIKKIREKLHSFFRDSFDPGTSESEEEREILLNCLKRKKQQCDDLFCDVTTDEEMEDILKRDKKSTRDTSANNSQKDIESIISAKAKSDDSCDSTERTEKYHDIYDATTDEEIEDGTTCTCDMLINNSQENTESVISANVKSGNSCDSIVCIEKNCPIYEVITDEEAEDGASICKRGTSANNSQENKESAIPAEVKFDNLCDSTAFTEKYYPMHDAAITEELDGVSTCKRGTSANNSQENKGSAIPAEVKSDNSCDTTAFTEKYYPMHDAAITEELDGVSTCKRGTSANNSQENKESAIPAEVQSDNSYDSTAFTEKYYPMYDTAITEEIEDGASTCKRGTSANNSQENEENAISAEVKSDNSCDSTAFTEKNYPMHEAITDEEIRAICKRDTSTNKSQKNKESPIPAKTKFNNSSDSTASTEKYYSMHDATTAEDIENGASTCKRDTSADNSQENKESAIPAEVKSDSSCNSTAPTKKHYPIHDATTVKEIENGASICKPGTSANNSQKNEKSVIPTEAKSDNLCDSIASNEKYHAMCDAITDEEVEDGASLCNRGTSANNSENIENTIPAKEQCIEDSSLTVNTENSIKNNACAEHSEGTTPATIEMDVEGMRDDMHLNQDLEKKADTIYTEVEEINAQTVLQNQQKDREMRGIETVDLITEDIETQKESTSCNVGEKNGYDVLQNVENSLLTTSDSIADDEQTMTVDQLLVTSLKSERNPSENRRDEAVRMINTPLNESNSNDSHLSDGHRGDDDNNSDIEVEIKIKPKLKSRISRKFSLKAPWSAVNTCIKNLNTLKDNPGFLNELFQMNDKTTFEKSRHKTTTRSPEDNTSLNVNQNVTAKCIETVSNTHENIRYSSPTTKDNANCSQQQQKSQDYLIIDKNENTMDHNQGQKDKRTQSVIQKTQITVENNPGSSKLACDTSDLGKQLPKTSMTDKQKINEEQQKSSNNTTLEKDRNAAEHKQREQNQCIPSIERKKTQVAIENSPESAKAAYDIGIAEAASDVGEQLPKTSSDATRGKVRVRSIAELNCQLYTIESTNHNALAISDSVCSASSQSVLPQSTLPQSTLPQSTLPQSTLPQSAPPQSVPLQSAPPQSAPSQSALPQSAPLQSAPLQLAPPQSVPRQSAPFQLPPPLVPFQSTSPQSASFHSAPFQSSPVQSTPFHSAPFQSASVQSTPYQSASSQSASPQSVPKRPLYNTAAVRHAHPSSRANAPYEINSSNISNDLKMLTQIIIRSICANFSYCREITRYKLLSPEFIEKMYISMQQIKKDLENLKIWWRMNDVESAIAFINQQVIINQPITIKEYDNYVNLISAYVVATQIPEQYAARSNVSQYPNGSDTFRGPAPNASVPNTNTCMANASLRNIRMPNRGRFQQSSTTPRSAPTIPNVNQQQLLGNSPNSPQVSHLRQPTPNICQPTPNICQSTPNICQPTPNIRQQYTYYASPTVHSDMPNANQQQSLRNANHSIQGQYMPPADITNISNQQIFANMSNVSSTSSPNTRSYGPVNQGNTNATPTTKRQSRAASKNTINSTATASSTNAQQQKQVYPQTPQINLGITICPPPMTNQNVFLGAHQHNVTISGFLIPRPDAPRTGTAMGNAKQQANCNLQVPRASLEGTQLLPQHNPPPNPGEMYHAFKPQPAHSNTQEHLVHNIPNPNVQQRSQQKTQQKTQQVNDTSVRPIDLSINTSQNVQQNVLNKGAEIPESQNKNRTRNKAPSTNPQQDVHQGTSGACNVPQNTSGTIPKTPTSQGSDIFRQVMSKSSLQNDGAMLVLPKSTVAVSQTNEVVTFNFNLSILTDIQKIVLRNQIQSYFLMSDQLQRSLKEQEFRQLHHERKILFRLYQYLHNYVNKMITESQTAQRHTEKDSQDNISQNMSVLQEDEVQILPSDNSTRIKTQSNQNKNNLACNRNLKNHSSKKSVDSKTSKNSESTAAKNNLSIETRSRESFFTPESAITREPLPGVTKLQEHNNNTLKKQFPKSSLLDAGKRPDTETSLPGCSKTPEENSNTQVSGKNSEMEMQDSAKINESLKSLAKSPRDRRPESCSLLAQKPISKSNYLLDALTNKTESRSEIAQCNANERFNKMETESVRGTSNVVTNRGNDTISRASYNAEDRNKEVCNANNGISNENLQDGMRDDGKENTVRRILNSTEIQSDPLNIPCTLISTNMWESISPIKKCGFTKTSQVHPAREECAKTISEFCLNTQQEDPTNERNNNSISRETNCSSESSGKLYIDESMDTSQEEQRDKVSSSEENNLDMSQDSFNTIRCESTEAMSLSNLLENIAETDLTGIRQNFVTKAQDAEKLNEESPLKAQTQLQEMSLKFKVSEDTWNTAESTMRSIDTVKVPEDTEEKDNEQSPPEIEEMEFQEMSFKCKVPEDASSTGEITMQSTDTIKGPEDTEGKDNEQSPSEIEGMQFQKISFKCDVPKGELSTGDTTMQSTDTIKGPKDTEEKYNEQLPLKVEEIQFQEMSFEFEIPVDFQTPSTEKTIMQSIDTVRGPEDTKGKNNMQSPSKMEEMQEMSSKFVPEDASSTGESSTVQPIYLKLPEDTEEEKIEMDTHSGIKTINEQLKHVSEQKYHGKPQTSLHTSVSKDDPTDKNAKEEVPARNDILNADDECISVKSDDSEVAIVPNILSVRSISPSLFEKIDNIDTFHQNDLESLHEKDEKSLDINDNLGSSDEIDDGPCLRCKRKSTVYCQACLQAPYCSKRCSYLHWNAEHYKQCRIRDSIICIDDV